jgi:hypothetical protein
MIQRTLRCCHSFDLLTAEAAEVWPRERIFSPCAALGIIVAAMTGTLFMLTRIVTLSDLFEALGNITAVLWCLNFFGGGAIMFLILKDATRRRKSTLPVAHTGTSWQRVSS